jgi:hypothetical protein
MNTHSVYGNFQYNVWMPVYAHRTLKKTKIQEFKKQNNYQILFIDNHETPFIIRNIKTKNYINPCRGSFYFTHNKKTISYSIIHVALASAFPNIPAKETVDHINDNPNDNRIINLQWMDRSENSRKGQLKSVKQSNKNGGRRCKHVIMRKPNENDKKNREKSVLIGLFRNIDKCAKFVIDNVVQREDKPKLKTVAAKIRRAIARPELKAYGYYYDAYEIQIENEEWKSHPKYPKYQLSTHGRFRNSQGIISQQVRSRNGSYYKTVGILGNHKYIHRLVWQTFVGEIPEGYDIMHDDTAPKYEDGSYRNWLCDLSIGKRSENMVSFHAHKNTQNTIVNENINEIIPQKKTLLNGRQYPNNPLGELMSKAPKGIQYVHPKNRGTSYSLGRTFSKSGREFKSSGSKKKSDEEKFLQILKIYQEHCIEEKQVERYMNVNIEDYKQYIPKLKN